MIKKSKVLVLVGVGLAAITLGGYAASGYMRAVIEGKSVREGSATVVQVRNLTCEEWKQLTLDEADKNWECSPDERTLVAYLTVDRFHTLKSDDEAFLLRSERENEQQGIWRCAERRAYSKYSPDFDIGEHVRFQFQFFPSHFGSERSALIFLGSCKE